MKRQQAVNTEGDPVEQLQKRLAGFTGPAPWVTIHDFANDPAARGLLAYVEYAPGCSMREAGQILGLARHRMTNLCRQLTTESKLFIAQAPPSGLLLFPYVDGIDGSWKQVAALRDRDTARLYLHLRAGGQSREVDLVGPASAWGLSRGGLQRRLIRLENARLVRSSRPRGGGRRTYVAKPLAAAALRILPLAGAISVSDEDLTGPREGG